MSGEQTGANGLPFEGAPGDQSEHEERTSESPADYAQRRSISVVPLIRAAQQLDLAPEVLLLYIAATGGQVLVVAEDIEKVAQALARADQLGLRPDGTSDESDTVVNVSCEAAGCAASQPAEKLYFNLAEAAAFLEIPEEGVKCLVRRGKLREFRDSGKLNYRVDELKKIKAAGIDPADLVSPTGPRSSTDDSDAT